MANLYETVNVRVKSHEWKLAGMASKQRQTELEKCEEMYEEARQKLIHAKNTPKSKGRGKGKKGTANIQEQEAKFHDLHVHLRTLQREVEMDKKERISVENSIKEHLCLALSSFVNGLSLCSVNDDELTLSKYMFRMVSLWFRSEDEMTDTDEVNKIMMKAAKVIPSYLFVPLTYQLFSRIGQPSDGKRSFQKALRSIISIICIEHPYHGILQLIALANGNKVGKGVSGRQSTTFLENIGEAKIEAAKELLIMIKKTAPDFIGSLISSYNTLIDSYIVLAMAPTEQFISGSNPRTKNISLSSAFPSRQIPSLDRCLGTSTQWCNSSLPIPCILTKPVSIKTIICDLLPINFYLIILTIIIR